MQTLFAIAEKIQTPLSLSALMLLILFYLFRIIFQRLRLELVLGPEIYKLLMRAMTYLFSLAIIALVLGLLSYALTALLNLSLDKRADALLQDLQDSSPLVRIPAIDGLKEMAVSSSPRAARTCNALATFVRGFAATSLSSPSERLSDDIQRAVKTLSDLTAGQSCAKIDLSGSDLRRLQLPGGNLTEAILTNARFDQANMVGANLRGARLSGAVFTEAKAMRTDFQFARVHDVKWHRADISGANFTSAQGLAGADLMSARMDKIVLDDTDLSSTKLSNYPITGGSYRNADIRRTDFSQVSGICRSELGRALGPPMKEPAYVC
ncbi:pentapeptide repeat-containing protein [Bradyrhizobium sp. 23AC]